MWFSPGLLTAAVLVCLVDAVTGSMRQWWLWIAAIAVSLLIDALLRVRSKDEPAVKTRKTYRKE